MDIYAALNPITSSSLGQSSSIYTNNTQIGIGDQIHSNLPGKINLNSTTINASQSFLETQFKKSFI